MITHLDYLLSLSHLICKIDSYSEIQGSGLFPNALYIQYTNWEQSQNCSQIRPTLLCPARCVLSPAGVRKHTEPLDKTGPPSICVPDAAFPS